MAWGKSPAGVASWVEKLKANDPSLTSVTVFRGRLFGAAEASEVCAALRTNTHLAELYASGHPMDASTAALFADMLATNATLRSLCVGDDAFGDAGLAALAPGVARSASLAALDLENKGVGDAGAEALGAALATASLSELILSRNPALGSRGVAAVCAGAAAGGRLAALRLAELALDGDAPAALAHLLASPCPLALLDLDRVRAFVDADGPTKLREGLARRRARGAAPLDALSLDGVPLGDAGAVALAGGDCSAESSSPSSSPSALPVRSLSLRGCGVGAAGARALAGAIASTETLRLGDNAVGDDGAASLAEALPNASSLATLDVSSNGVGAVGAAALVRGATTLRELSLFGNEAIGDAGLAAATEAAGAGGAASLAYLDAGGCGATETGLVALCEALIARADVFPKLETLVVGGNPGTQSDAWEPALGRLRDARPGLDVAWRAADAGDSKEEREAGERLLAQHREQQAGLPPPTP